MLEGGEPTVIANAEGSRLTSSVVGFNKAGERLVGASAKRQRRQSGVRFGIAARHGDYLEIACHVECTFDHARKIANASAA